MASSTARPILDLGALEPERSHVRIDGADYRYRADMDLDLVHLARIERIRQRIAELYTEAERTPAQIADPARAELVADMIREGVQLVMFDPIPGDVLDKLNDVQRLAILDAFTRATSRAASRTSSKARPAKAGAKASTSPRSSRASSGSTPRRRRRSG